MQTIGLVGGMSWESTAVYYRDLNPGVQSRLGGLSSPKVVLSTVDFAELTALEDADRWPQIGDLLADAARGVERGGPTSCCCAPRRSTRWRTRSRRPWAYHCSISATSWPRRCARRASPGSASSV